MTFCTDFSTDLRNCTLCPRCCEVDRIQGQTGFCGLDAGLHIAAIVCHRGEEPVLGGEAGICNVFFRHCNLQCGFCQNRQISANQDALPPALAFAEALGRIIRILETGVTHLGFVSPSPMVPHMVALIRAVRDRGFRPTVVYNSGGYDSVDTLRRLEGLVDVYLPDCKYRDPALARDLSAAADYPDQSALALREMYRQMGRVLHLDEAGLARRGLIVRHLVLPGQTADSLAVLRFLADELSSGLTLSLMAQYCPGPDTAQWARGAGYPDLGRRLLPEEYAVVLAEAARLGLSGFTQDLASADCLRPDFAQDNPFD